MHRPYYQVEMEMYKFSGFYISEGFLVVALTFLYVSTWINPSCNFLQHSIQSITSNEHCFYRESNRLSKPILIIDFFSFFRWVDNTTSSEYVIKVKMNTNVGNIETSLFQFRWTTSGSTWLMMKGAKLNDLF